MTIQDAISKAVEGGYDPNWNVKVVSEFPELEYRAVLDPAFWRALAPSMGWDEEPPLEPEWRDKWHNLIDHLARGGTIESFFATL